VIYLPGDLPGTVTGAGYLRPDLIKDAVHANHVYSAVLLDTLAATLAARSKEPL
jgi:hypothetical protein